MNPVRHQLDDRGRWKKKPSSGASMERHCDDFFLQKQNTKGSFGREALLKITENLGKILLCEFHVINIYIYFPFSLSQD